MARAMDRAQQGSPQPFKGYFNKLSTGYSRQTGNSTYQLIEQVLQELRPAVTSSSVVHDNACGPGTATMAVIAHIGSEPSLIKPPTPSQQWLKSCRPVFPS